MKRVAQSFWDTSALVALCCPHPSSAVARRAARQTNRIAVWWGTPVEMSSAFSQLVRTADLNDGELSYALKRKSMLGRQWDEIEPSARLRDLAERLPDQYRLRALDALQLAAALIWCKEKPRNRPFASFDLPLAHAAAKAGFSVIT